MTGSPYPEIIVAIFAAILGFFNTVQVVANFRCKKGRKGVKPLTRLFHILLALASVVLFYSAVTLIYITSGVIVTLALASNELIAFIGVVLLSQVAHQIMIAAKTATFDGTTLSPLYFYALSGGNGISAISWFAVLIIMATADNDTKYKSIPFLLTATTMLILIVIVLCESCKIYGSLRESASRNRVVRGSQSVLNASGDLTRAPTDPGSPPSVVRGHSRIPSVRIVPDTATRAPLNEMSALRRNAGGILLIAIIAFVWITYSGIRKAQETGHAFYSPDSKPKSSLFNAFMTHIFAVVAIGLFTWIKWDRTSIPMWRAEFYYPQPEVEQNEPVIPTPEGAIGLVEIDVEAPTEGKIDIPDYGDDQKETDAELNEEINQNESSTSDEAMRE